jgi:hypothetical protein
LRNNPAQINLSQKVWTISLVGRNEETFPSCRGKIYPRRKPLFFVSKKRPNLPGAVRFQEGIIHIWYQNSFVIIFILEEFEKCSGSGAGSDHRYLNLIPTRKREIKNHLHNTSGYFATFLVVGCVILCQFVRNLKKKVKNK